MDNATRRLREAAHSELESLERSTRRPVIETTLYDLVQALDEDLRADEQGMVARTLEHLMHTGRLKWLSADMPDRLVEL